MDYKRARTAKQIENRVSEIVRCAIEIYEKDGLERLNFLEISKKTNFTRPTIYKYFSTKEEVMLSLILHYMEKLVQEVCGGIDENSSAEQVARVLTNGFENAPQFMDLFGILYTVIEKNSCVEALANFKREIMAYQAPLAQCIQRATKCSSEIQVYKFLVLAMSLALGLYPMCKLSDVQKQAIAQSGTGYVAPSFSEEYFSAVLLQVREIEKNHIYPNISN